MSLLGLTPATARRVAAKLDEADARGGSFAETVARPTAWVKVTGAALSPTGLSSSDPVFPAVVCQLKNNGTWEEFGTCRAIVISGGTPATNERLPAWQTGHHTDGVAQFYCVRGSAPDATACVRVVTWVTCNTTGGLVATFKWITLPAAWVFDTAQPGCPTAGTP